MRLIILGPAGAGKGTLAEKIKKYWQISYIATGNMFRAEIQQASKLGLLAKEYIDAGKLVPDDVTIAMVMERLQAPDCSNGFLLDGFPRTLVQAEALRAALSQSGLDIEMVLNLVIDFESLSKRIVGRRICPNCDGIYNVYTNPPLVDEVCDKCGAKLVQRSDDTEEQLRVRMAEHQSSTSAVLAYYRSLGKVVDLDASLTPTEILEEVLKIFGRSL